MKELEEAFKSFMDTELPSGTAVYACDLASNYMNNYQNAKHEAYGFIEGWFAGIKYASKISQLEKNGVKNENV